MLELSTSSNAHILIKTFSHAYNNTEKTPSTITNPTQMIIGSVTVMGSQSL